MTPQRADKKLRIGILSQNKKLYSTKRLVEAAKQRGHFVEVIDTTRCYVNIASAKPSVHYMERTLNKFHAIIPRIAASITFFGTAIVRQFEMTGTYTLNESLAIARSRDKLRSLQILSKHGIGLPQTGFAHSTQMSGDLIRLAGGAPLIIKLLQGTQGKGVVLTPTDTAAESVIDAFRGLRAHFVVQEFIKEAGGSDIRCFVIGDKVVASMQRQAKEGEFRSNIHRGGSASTVKITPDERSTAVRSAKLLGLSVAGVDLLRSERGPVVMEVNSSPGLEGIETASGKNIADLIIRHIEKNWQQSKARKRKQG